MDRLVVLKRVFYALAVSLGLIGVAVLAMWSPSPAAAASARRRSIEEATAPVAARAEGEDRPTPLADIITSNVFSADRSPPRARYIPPNLLAVQDSGGALTAPAKPRVHELRLYGITIGPGTPRALIDADPKVPGAEIYGVGDAVGAQRLVAISDTTVVLEGPAGRRELRLAPPRRGSP